MTQQISKTLLITAPPAVVWDALTNTAKMKQWMAEPAMKLEIITNWKTGSPIIIKGFHHIKFENKGTVLQILPPHLLQYNHLSSLSRLQDKPENYSIITFNLVPLANNTSLTLTLSNFPTEAIFRHLDFYWRTTTEILKKMIETQ